MTRSLTVVFFFVGLLSASPPLVAQPPDADRIADLEAALRTAQARVAELESTLDSLAAAVIELKAQPSAPEKPAANAGGEYVERIMVADLGNDDRDEQLRGKPELFVQSAYFANRIDTATEDDADVNFGINRMELAWAGSVSERFGLGFELQYHPAPDGASEELINDAYVDFYASDAITLRAGQFVKPFGFDIQHSSSDRESPERGIFAGYFFPGQRDRGFLLRADLAKLGWLDGTTLDAAILNGNRFFADNNDSLNYNLRLRHLFPSGRLAVGASLQAGTQILAPGVPGDDDENAYGADLQYVVGRLGIRAEYVRGNTPSTLLGLDPEFAPAFTPGDESWGATAFFNWNLTTRDDVYWRWDRFDNDPVTGQNPRTFNVGYMRRVGDNSRVAVDYQWKDDVTFNDDGLNTAFMLRWDIVY
jgi:hypothetical protein